MLGIGMTHVREAVRSLYATKQRSVLALIGIMIGIGSVVAVVSVGMSAKTQVLEQFRELGTEMLGIQKIGSGSPASHARIRLADATAMARNTQGVAAAAPWIRHIGDVTHAGIKLGKADFLGVTMSFAELNKLKAREGRFISDLDFRQYYCVVGAQIAHDMRSAGPGPLLGEPIKLDGRICTVVGVLQETARGGMRTFDPNRSIFLPITTAQRTFASPEIRTITARMHVDMHYTTVAEAIRAYFSRRAPGIELQVRSSRELIEQMERQMRLFTLLLSAIGSISLFVGGVGIMNVMLVSVTERRNEIGIRRALGARRRDIRNQFLIESMILSLFGGVFGIALGGGAALAICNYSGWTFELSPVIAALGFGVASFVGIFFGFYPAWQASRMDPIAALRSV